MLICFAYYRELAELPMLCLGSYSCYRVTVAVVSYVCWFCCVVVENFVLVTQDFLLLYF